MNTRNWLLAIVSLSVVSCSIPRPTLEPAPLVDDTKTDDSETSESKPDSEGVEIPACADDPKCKEACEPEPEEVREDCVEAYQAGCFSDTRPDAEEYDCREFGQDPPPTPVKKNRKKKEDVDDGGQIEEEAPDEDQFLDIPEHD